MLRPGPALGPRGRAPPVSAARWAGRTGLGAAGAEAASRVAESEDACPLGVAGARVQSRGADRAGLPVAVPEEGFACLPWPPATATPARPSPCSAPLLRPHRASPLCAWVFAGLVRTLTAGLRSSPDPVCPHFNSYIHLKRPCFSHSEVRGDVNLQRVLFSPGRKVLDFSRGDGGVCAPGDGDRVCASGKHSAPPRLRSRVLLTPGGPPPQPLEQASLLLTLGTSRRVWGPGSGTSVWVTSC